MCDGEPIWTQQGAVVEHVAERKKKKSQSECFLPSRTDKRLLFDHKSSVNIHTFVEREVSPNMLEVGKRAARGRKSAC